MPTSYTEYDIVFDKEFARKMARVKESTIKKGTNHYNSKGLSYLFGNKGCFKKANNSLVDFELQSPH